MDIKKTNKIKVDDDLENVCKSIKELVDVLENIKNSVDDFAFYFYDEKESFNKMYDYNMHWIKYDGYYIQEGKEGIKNNDKDLDKKMFVENCLMDFDYINKVNKWWNKFGWEQFYKRFDGLNNEQKVEANENMFTFKSLVEEFYRVDENLKKNFEKFFMENFKIDCNKFSECVKENKLLNINKLASIFVDGKDVDKRVNIEKEKHKKILKSVGVDLER